MLAPLNITGDPQVFSVSLDLPEFDVFKQVFLEDCNLLHVEERCSTPLSYQPCPHSILLFQ
jgi:hypothetical protein